MSQEYKATGFVQEKHWGPDDDYLTVEVQVPMSLFRDGERVNVVITKIIEEIHHE